MVSLSRLENIFESTQNIIFCLGLLKKEQISKSDKITNDLLKILEKNSLNIYEDIRTLRN